MSNYQSLNNLGTLKQSFHFKVSPQKYKCCMGNPGRPKKLSGNQNEFSCNNANGTFPYCKMPNNIWSNRCETNPSNYVETFKLYSKNYACVI